jgi:hypothetical protein
MATVSGALEIVVSKKNNKPQYFVNYANLKGKSVRMPLLDSSSIGFRPEDAQNGSPVTITLSEDQKPIKVTIDGKAEVVNKPKLPPPPNYQDNKNFRPNQPSGGYKPGGRFVSPVPKIPATAPYNFVPYEPTRLVPSNYDPQAATFSGSIRCHLETKTPLLVASNIPLEVSHIQSSGEEELREKRFIQVNGVKVIPGSSLKGMFRSIIEILSFSSLTPINAESLYYRNFEDKNRYCKLLGVSSEPKQKCGWLVREGSDFFLSPSEFVSATTPSAKAVKVNKIKSVDNNRSDRATYYFAAYQSSSPKIKLNDNIIVQFNDQLTPAQNKYLFERAGVTNIYELSPIRHLPVFYVDDIGTMEIVFIGLCKFFRIPYKYRPIDYITPKDSALETDFTRTLFGHSDVNASRKGRISFSHAELKTLSETTEGHLVTLGQPNVTCLSNYLEQNNSGQRMDYNRPDAKIRGRKCYWHRNWELDKLPRGNVNTDNLLFPVGVGSQGHFTVNVSRVTLEELGAVFLALELWPESAHKMGLGKAVGLGSIKVTIDHIEVSPFGQRYRSLSGRLTNQGAEERQDLKEKAVTAFKGYVSRSLSPFATADLATAYDLLPEIKAFRAITDYTHRPNNDATKYMDLKEFKKKYILPDILTVFNK